jgi:hypothetical protein
VLTVSEILAAIEQLPAREQQELSQVVVNLPVNIQPKNEVDRADFWMRVEQFRALIQAAEIDVNEIWEDVRDRSPGREVDLWSST